MSDKYDDLDDILDDFEEQDRVLGAPAKAETTQEIPASAASATTATTASAPTTTTGAADDDELEGLDEEFAKKLALGMESLGASLGNDPHAKAELEALMASLGVQGSDDTTKNPASFEDTISQTVNRLNESKQTVGDSLAGSDDFLEKMLGELQNAAGGGGDMDSLLASLMEELSSKDILYEPIKEMHDKYPKWLEDNAKNLSAEELARYKHQQTIVNEIVAKFQDPKYSDTDQQCREFVALKMAEMQESGAPPQELVGDLAEGSLPGADLFGGGAPGAAGGQPECPVQ